MIILYIPGIFTEEVKFVFVRSSVSVNTALNPCPLGTSAVQLKYVPGSTTSGQRISIFPSKPKWSENKNQMIEIAESTEFLTICNL